MADVKKATFNLPVEEIEALKSLANSEHKTVTEILRRAIKAELFLSENYKQGNKILIESKDQPMREVIRA
jgi:predicted DNA-binding protein